MKSFVDKARFVFLIIVTLAAAALGILELMHMQIIDGSKYYEQTLSTYESVQLMSAPRGQIVDSEGEFLVSNKSGYNIIAQKAFFPDDEGQCNQVLLDTARLIMSEGLEYDDILPISTTEPFEFLPDREKDIERLRKNIGVQVYATAPECIVSMARKYSIYSKYTAEEVRIIAGLRYTMERRDFSVSNVFTFTEDVPMSAAVRIKEHSAELTGIDVDEEAVRVNNIGDVVPHLIGTVGAISAEEYEKLKDDGYALNDTIGKGGIESAMERTLRGQKGERQFTFISGLLTGDEVIKQPVPGRSIKLTVNSAYQRRVQEILENHITWLQNQSSPDRKGENADAGAIVVLNARTGALLAAATYPTYDLLDYIDNYSKVASGNNSPLTNRAISGRYRPGSTFKTVTATAALNEGIITQHTTVDCHKYYTYWEDWVPPPECTGYHNRLNVIEALRESCNVFFYDVGRITGIETIASYASRFGLGEEMGLEIGRGVKIGYIATPETFEARGDRWQAGNVIQAAIGQSDTYVTPLQMAAQAMTIANSGVRYRTYMVDSVYDYNMENLISVTRPEVAETIMDKTGMTFYCVTEGMKEAARFDQYALYPRCSDYYTDNYLLTSLPRSAAIKTGTPQMTTKQDTGSAFIGFYPADDPEIAFAGFVEHGEYSKFMVKDIIESYYAIDAPAEEELQPVIPADEIITTTKVTTSYDDEDDDYYDDDYYDDYDYDYYYDDEAGEPVAIETLDETMIIEDFVPEETPAPEPAETEPPEEYIPQEDIPEEEPAAEPEPEPEPEPVSDE